MYGIIGNANKKKLSDLVGITWDEVLLVYEGVGKALAEKGHAILMVPEGAMLAVARAYKRAGGKEFVGLVPSADTEWGCEHVNATECDRTIDGFTWVEAPYQLVKNADAFIELGFGTGTCMELNFVKYNNRFLGENKKVIVVKELLRNGRLPVEVEYDLKDTIDYVGVRKIKEKV